jgi:hypothetical protein
VCEGGEEEDTYLFLTVVIQQIHHTAAPPTSTTSSLVLHCARGRGEGRGLERRGLLDLGCYVIHRSSHKR